MVALLLTAHLFGASPVPVAKPCDALPAPLRIWLTFGTTKWKQAAPTIRQLVEETWLPAGLRIEWLPDDAANEIVDFRIAFVHGLKEPSDGGAIGMVQFHAGKPQPMARVSIDAAILWARHYQARLLQQPMNALRSPEIENPDIVRRVMGYAAAHEMGHFVLASKAHASRGLMHGTFPSALSNSRVWRLDEGSQARLQHRLDGCGGTRLSLSRKEDRR
jgi:hypothetical protein